MNATLHIIDPALEEGAVHVAVLRGDGRDHAWILGPAEKVAAYRQEILDTVRDVIDQDRGPLTLYDALVHLAKNNVEGLEVPPIVRYSALAVLQDAHVAKGMRWEGVKVT